MSTPPDPVQSVFADYTAGTTAEVRHSGTDALWRKAKRRRIGRAATAGAAALALVASASWLLVNGAAPDEESPAAEEPSEAEEELTTGDDISVEEDQSLDLFGPGPDIVGTEMVLPPFVPGDADVDEVCAADGAVLEDGRYEEPTEDGAVFFVEDTASNMSEDGTDEFREIGLFGCRYGDETLYQAVTLDEVEDDTWVAGDQLIHSEPGGESPQYLIATERDGLVVGVAERYDPVAHDLRYRAERIFLDDGGAPARSLLGELDGDGFSDLKVEATATPTEEAGVWTVTLEVHNTGPRTVLDHTVSGHVDDGVEIIDGEAVTHPEDPAWWDVGRIDELAPGEVYIQEWTVSVDEPVQPWWEMGPLFQFGVESSTIWEERPPAVVTLSWGQESAWCDFVE